MKCDNCGTKVNQEFSFAIKNNQCPACGKNIMLPDKLVAYMSLCELLRTSCNNINNEEVANLIIANFDIKQKFKELVPITQIKSEIVMTESSTMLAQNVVEPQDKVEISDEMAKDSAKLSPEDTDKAFDEEFKKNQMREAKEKLKQMRDQVYEEALKDQWGLGEENQGLLIPDGNSMIDAAQQMKKDQSHQNVISGVRGSFRRG